MSARRKRSGLFVCFGGGDPEEEVVGIRRRRRSRKIYRQIFDKMKRSTSFVTSPRSKGGKEETNRSDKLAPESIFSSDSSPSLGSSSSIASSSSFCSSSSSASFPDPTETKSRPRRRPVTPPAAAQTARRGAATGVFLLLVSLCVMVFCGRLCAILLTSSSLCLAPRRIRAAPSLGKVVDRVSSPSFRRRKVWKGDEEDEEEEKRRVVLEGLLERKRRI
ncbi:uncharacterized protein [Typha angustifolia]|uniref:uncharacterized protein isoform X2 n=1 Tax=Typha angustifolia TaxID=59011 RepID=UPI003C2BF1D3